MRLLLFFIVVAVIMFFVITALISGVQKKKCKGVSTARFMYADCNESPNPQKVPNVWIPVYEFVVGDTVYMVRLGRTGPSEKSFPFEAQVIYNTDDPGICFIDGARGKVISRHDDPDRRASQEKEDMTKKEDDPWGAYDDDSRYDYFTRT